ncbi:MAG: class I SAM-dependent methyltransferase [Microthrixaceae bacterium]
MADRPRFERITEYPDTPASAFQLQCAAARYSLIRSLSCPGDVVVEVGCGSGVGLNRLRESGRQAVGIDISLANLSIASQSAPVSNATAEELPLRSGAAMVTALPEAIYYIEDQPAAIAELARVTAKGGHIIVSWPDSRRPGFVASPFATRYPHPDTMQTWLTPWCSSLDMRGAFAVEDETPLVRIARGLAGRLGLIPRTLHRRGQLKRLLGRGAGTMDDFELDDDRVPHEPLSRGTERPRHIMLYAIGVRS